MILVPSRQQPLSGNNFFIILCTLILFSACSKKVIPTMPVQKPEPVEIVLPKVKEPVKSNLDHSIVLLLPFQLNDLNLKTTSKLDLDKLELAIDFYQGFKLGLDSVSAGGHNFSLHVFDTQSQETQIVNLALSQAVKDADLIVGPIFPEGIKTFSEFSELGKVLQVSPLAASMPTEFNNPKLVSITNSIDQHAKKIVDFITQHYKPESVQLILAKSLNPEDVLFSNYIKRYLEEWPESKFRVVERADASNIEGHLKSNKNNLVLVSSSDRKFLVPLIDKLYSLKNQNYQINLFGHPNWIKANFLSPAKMQALNTRISASYFVNYKALNVKKFIAQYREKFKLEPSEYAFKGFDCAFYFGLLLQKYDKQYIDFLINEDYSGLQNDFHFLKDATLGYRNTALMLLMYQNFELQLVK